MDRIAADPMLFRRPLSGRRLTVARVAWLVVAVPTLALSAFGFWAGFDDLTLLGPGSIFVALGQAGIQPATSVLIGLVLPMVLMTVIAAVVFWKRPNDPMALLTSLMLITFAAASSRSTFAAVSTVPQLSGLARTIFAVGFGSLVLVFALFPNGHSVPGKAWLAAPVVALIVLALPELPREFAMFPDRPADFDVWSWRFNLIVLITTFAFVIICQVYRYRKVSTQLERLQAKWVVLPLALSGTQVSLIALLSLPFFNLGPAWAGWAQLSVIPATLLLPVGIAAAILRYRLYDIERIVSRTVAYGLLTSVLFGVYAALVFVLRELMPLQGDLAVAGSTLGVAALANPLRTRIQRAVDFRFNRTHADAERTLSEFSKTLRIASDSGAVIAQVQSAVERSFEPDSFSVWMRSGSQTGAGRTR
jgi:hypothetical protein